MSNYNFNAVIVKHKIALKEEFYDNTDRKRYSQNFVNWFNENLKQKNWLQSAIEHHKVQLKKTKNPLDSGFLLRITSCKRIAYQPVFSLSAEPISAKERTVLTPAASNAANFSSAVPLPPAIIAPA